MCIDSSEVRVIDLFWHLNGINLDQLHVSLHTVSVSEIMAWASYVYAL